MEPYETYINWIANFLNIRSTLPRFSNVGLNGKNVIFQRVVNTHWHVGEKIAVAEKEALPEAAAWYWLFLSTQTGYDDSHTTIFVVTKIL